jgi:predicted CopG family antitoxin
MALAICLSTKVIPIGEQTYNKLTEHGKWRDTMDDIILRLLQKAGCAGKEVGK